MAPSELRYVFVAATARSSPASSGSTASAVMRERRVRVVRDRDRRPPLPPRLEQHRHDVRRRARLRDADHEAAVEPRRLAVDRVERRRREHHGHAVRAPEHVLRVAGGVARRAARRDQDVADVLLAERARELGCVRPLPLEQPRERRRLLAKLGLKPRHGPLPRRERLRSRAGRRGRRCRPAPPGSSTPRSGRPMIVAGTVVAAPIACSNGIPSACRLRTASIIVSTRAGEHAVVARRHAVRPPRPRSRRADTSPAPSPAPAIASVTSASAAAGGRPDELHRVVREVVAVDDHLHEDVTPRERDADDARIARAARAHRVEQVRDGGDAELERCVRLGGGRVRVARRDDDAARAAAGDQRVGARQLRRERQLGDAAGVEQPVEQREIRVAPMLERMRAEALGREERALEVRADHARARRPRPAVARSASTIVLSDAVMNVGWYAVTPVSSSASPARA